MAHGWTVDGKVLLPTDFYGWSLRRILEACWLARYSVDNSSTDHG